MIASFLISICWFSGGIFDRVAIALSSVNWAVLLTGICAMSAAYGLQKAGRQTRLAGLGFLVGSVMAYTGLFDLVHKTPIELLFLNVADSITN